MLYSQGDKKLLEREILCLSGGKCNSNFENSLLIESKGKCEIEVLKNLLELPFLAERALITLSSEYNILNKDDFKELVNKFSLSKEYIQKILVLKEHKGNFEIS